LVVLRGLVGLRRLPVVRRLHRPVLIGLDRGPGGLGRDARLLDLRDPTDETLPLPRPQELGELVVDLVRPAAEAREEPLPPRPPGGRLALAVDGGGERAAVPVGEADLDRAAREEGRDPLAGNDGIAGADGRGHALVDVDDLAGARTVEELVQDPLPGGSRTTVRPPRCADLEDLGVPDRVDRAAPGEVDAHVDTAPGVGEERELVAAPRKR